MASVEWGLTFSLVGAAIAAMVSGAGSAVGVSIPGRAANGLLSEEPEKFGNSLILVALPGTQGIYGLIAGVIMLIILGILGGEPKHPSLQQGLSLLGIGVFMALVQFFSSVYQGKVCAAAMSIVAKHPEDSMKGVINAAMVETYGVLGLLITLLLLFFGVAPALQ